MAGIPSPRSQEVKSPSTVGAVDNAEYRSRPEGLVDHFHPRHLTEEAIDPASTNVLEQGLGRNRRQQASTAQGLVPDIREQQLDPLNQDLVINGGSEARLADSNEKAVTYSN
jgi:hypothetical protein